ncbi:MAG: hypothetical protein LBF04_06270 [Prevotellaceae bacterium]|jgi:hypothetical protein|nr:hypothetical protein [Prevotellaceae bacterium]
MVFSAVAEKQLETPMFNSMNATAVQIRKIKNLASAQQKHGIAGNRIQPPETQELSTYPTQKPKA